MLIFAILELYNSSRSASNAAKPLHVENPSLLFLAGKHLQEREHRISPVLDSLSRIKPQEPWYVSADPPFSVAQSVFAGLELFRLRPDTGPRGCSAPSIHSECGFPRHSPNSKQFQYQVGSGRSDRSERLRSSRSQHQGTHRK